MPATLKTKRRLEKIFWIAPRTILLKALKKDIVRKEGSVKSDKLRKEDYSERFITRLEDV